MTIHDFDMVRYLSGAEVEEVYAEGSVTVDPEIGKAGDIDTAIITLKLDNGATAVIDNCRAACYGYDQRAEVFGTKGCVAISNDSDSNAVYSCKDGVIAEKPMFFFLERYMMAYANEVNQFVEAIVNDTPTPVNANDGLQPVLIGLAAKKSVEDHLLPILNPIIYSFVPLRAAPPAAWFHTKSKGPFPGVLFVISICYILIYS